MVKIAILGYGVVGSGVAEVLQMNQAQIVTIMPLSWEQPYDIDTAFSVGTLFPCLNKPFLGGGR